MGIALLGLTDGDLGPDTLGMRVSCVWLLLVSVNYIFVVYNFAGVVVELSEEVWRLFF